MQLHKNKWPVTDNASRYRLFSELVLELVHRSSWESYRSHTLSTTMKAMELQKTLGKVRRREVPKPTLEPQIEEFTDAVSKDPIVAAILEKKLVPKIAFEITKGDSTERIGSSINLFLDVVAKSYQSECEDKIKRIFSERGSKKDLILATKLYVSYVINIGFSPDYIFEKTNSVFFKNDIIRCSTGMLDRFFKNFDSQKRVFEVFVACENSFLRFLKTQLGLQSYSDVGSLPGAPIGGISNTYGEGAKNGILHIQHIPAKDPYSAFQAAELIFSLSRSFLYLHPENVTPKMDMLAYVVNAKTKEVTKVHTQSSFRPRRASRSKSDQKESVQNLAKYVFSRQKEVRVGERDGQRRVFSSLNSAALASKADDPESRLLSIWAAFEALLPEPTKDGKGTVRILHFSSFILPSAVFDYLPNNFSECFRNCSAQFGSAFVDCVERLGVGDTEIRKFSSIFIANPDAQRDLCSTVSASPLMLMRFHRLQKLLNDPKEGIKYLNEHENRVNWQIHRIYRERNDIVHKASKSQFLDGLIENAYSYYRSVILALEKVNHKFEISHPDQGLELIRSLYREYKDTLSNISESRNSTLPERRSEFLAAAFSRCLLS